MAVQKANERTPCLLETDHINFVQCSCFNNSSDFIVQSGSLNVDRIGGRFGDTILYNTDHHLIRFS